MKWKIEEKGACPENFDDGVHTYCWRRLYIERARLADFSKLEGAMEDLFDGLHNAETEESYFVIQRGSLRHKVRWSMEVDIYGTREMTDKEKKEYEKRKKNALSKQEAIDLRALKRIASRNPQLFKLVKPG